MAECQLSADALTAASLKRMADSVGDGAATFVEVYREKALAEARAMDLLRAAGVPAGPLTGIPVSIQDIFDVAGSIRWAGSRSAGARHTVR